MKIDDAISALEKNCIYVPEAARQFAEAWNAAYGPNSTGPETDIEYLAHDTIVDLLDEYACAEILHSWHHEREKP